MVKYNNQAFDKLKEALGCKSYPVLLDRLEELGIRKVSLPTFYTWRDEGKIPMETLTQISNSTHFPLSYFFISDQADDKRAYTLIPEKEWNRVFFFPEFLYAAIRREARQSDVKCLHKFRKHLKEFNNGDFHAIGRLYVPDMVEICLDIGINLQCFILDLNVPLPEEEDALTASADSFPEMLSYLKKERIRQAELVKDKDRTIRELKARIRSVEEEKAQLQKSFDERREDLAANTEMISSLSHQNGRLLGDLKVKDDLIKELEGKLRNRSYYEKTKQKK